MEKIKDMLVQAPEGQKWSGQFNPKTRRVDLVLSDVDSQPNFDDISKKLDLIEAESFEKVRKSEEPTPETRRRETASKVYKDTGVLVLGRFGDMDWNK